jgi:outer membrane receptor for ferrienterochelin and colicin
MNWSESILLTPKVKFTLPRINRFILNIWWVLLIQLLSFPLIYAQKISGYIFGAQKEPLAGARIFWEDQSNGTTSDSTGYFSLPLHSKAETRLLASFTGHETDTTSVLEFQRFNIYLQKIKTLEEIQINAQKEGTILSDSEVIKTEQITRTELTKAACCDLAGCFETQTTVHPQTTNVITQSKELRILGLSGVYNQILLDGLPMIQGLSYTYGISNIPGTLVDNIYISKGANSTLQGYESISGQINVQTRDPDKGEILLLNTYINTFQEKHLNANYAYRRNKWSSLTAFHMVQPAARTDRDQDAFLDLPLLTRYGLFHKWKYGQENTKGFFSTTSVRFTNEERIGGQKGFSPALHAGNTTQYGQWVKYQQPEIMTKSGYRFSGKHALIFLGSALYHHQDSWFGTLRYQATQKSAYLNVQHEWNYGNHNLKTGISYRHLELREHITFYEPNPIRNYQGLYSRQENIPGFFSENTLVFDKIRTTWISGIRVDHLNGSGLQWAPRTMFKIDVFPKTVLRMNGGYGWRNVNLFSENIGILVSSRNVVWAEKLEPERAFNTGLNLTQKFENESQSISGYVSLDYYFTDFQNQIFPEYDVNPTSILIRNYSGTSRSDAFQAELKLTLWQRLECKTGYTRLLVYREDAGIRYELPFNTRNRWLNSISYKPLSNRFHVDMNIHHYGRQKLPNTQNHPIEFRRPDYSPIYSVINIQFTWTAGRWEFYTGVENLTDFRQLQPILSWQQPFGPWFDTSSVWGPTRGREGYAGIRYKIFQKEE